MQTDAFDLRHSKGFCRSGCRDVDAFAASMVAWSLGRAPWRIAASQRDIALDKLKFDLFQRRYGVYQVARKKRGTISPLQFALF